jgi:hypothetical protein
MTETAPHASLYFRSGWQEVTQGEIRRGENLSVHFDRARLPHCFTQWKQAQFGNIHVYIRCHPRGEIVRGSMLEEIRDPHPDGIVIGHRPVPFLYQVPTDTREIELWFHNFYDTSVRCDAWDSRYSQNYWFKVGGERPKTPHNPVQYRAGAITTPDMIKLFDYAVEKRNVFPRPTSGPREGTDLQTRLYIRAWVKNIAYRKDVWIDFHVFDENEAVIHAETQPLSWDFTTGEGDVFQFNGKIYQGVIATPGSVSPRPDARKVQYRLYYEVQGSLFTDGILYQRELPEDAMVMCCEDAEVPTILQHA